MTNLAVLSTYDVQIFFDAQRRQNIAAIDIDPEIEAERRSIVNLIAVFVKEGAIAPETGRTAASFINLLPADRAFPKMAADGEGGLMFVWEDPAETVMLTVDRLDLLPIVNPATPNAVYLHTANLKNADIPSRLLKVIPPR